MTDLDDTQPLDMSHLDERWPAARRRPLSIAKAFCAEALLTLVAHGWAPECDELSGAELDADIWQVIEDLAGPLPASSRGVLREKYRSVCEGRGRR